MHATTRRSQLFVALAETGDIARGDAVMNPAEYRRPGIDMLPQWLSPEGAAGGGLVASVPARRLSP